MAAAQNPQRFVIFAYATPIDNEGMQLRCNDELNAIRASMPQGAVVEVANASIDRIKTAIQACCNAHTNVVLHICCHGSENCIKMFDNNGAFVNVDYNHLSRELKNSLNQAGASMEFIFLSACLSARGAQEIATNLRCDAFGYTTEIADLVAANITELFYRQLEQGSSLNNAYKYVRNNVADSSNFSHKIPPNQLNLSIVDVDKKCWKKRRVTLRATYAGSRRVEILTSENKKVRDDRYRAFLNYNVGFAQFNFKEICGNIGTDFSVYILAIKDCYFLYIEKFNGLSVDILQDGDQIDPSIPKEGALEAFRALRFWRCLVAPALLLVIAILLFALITKP
jgi:hypothetical protein